MVFSLLGAALRRTTIYIDGYNLYYSRLRGTAFKWLDVVALFRDRILAVQDPTAQVIALKYFTAPIKAKYARHGAASEEAQAQYHRALLAKDPGMVQIIKGFHIFNRADAAAGGCSGTGQVSEQAIDGACSLGTACDSRRRTAGRTVAATCRHAKEAGEQACSLVIRAELLQRHARKLLPGRLSSASAWRNLI